MSSVVWSGSTFFFPFVNNQAFTAIFPTDDDPERYPSSFVEITYREYYQGSYNITSVIRSISETSYEIQILSPRMTPDIFRFSGDAVGSQALDMVATTAPPRPITGVVAFFEAAAFSIRPFGSLQNEYYFILTLFFDNVEETFTRYRFFIRNPGFPDATVRVIVEQLRIPTTFGELAFDPTPNPLSNQTFPNLPSFPNLLSNRLSSNLKGQKSNSDDRRVSKRNYRDDAQARHHNMFASKLYRDDDVSIEIAVWIDIFGKGLGNVRYEVEDIVRHSCGYFEKPTKRIVDGQVKFVTSYLKNPKITKVVRGKGATLDEKILDIVSRGDLLGYDEVLQRVLVYSTLRLILARLLYHEFDLKFLTNQFTERFFEDLSESRFDDFVKYFTDPIYGLVGAERYFREKVKISCCDHSKDSR
ncbi:Hypothetical protein POVR1_LOCUS536 [uncultured virus]|nr:Hypothetical protein POVR1_LOCUS536 [uncultured virus]